MAYQNNPQGGYPPNPGYPSNPNYLYQAPNSYNPAYPPLPMYSPMPQGPFPYENNPGPIYPNQPLQRPLVNSPRSHRSKFRLVIFACLVGIEILFLILMIVNIPWYSYCYWNFTLKHVSARDGSQLRHDSGTYSISDFYQNVCDTSYDYYPECPDLCTSVKPLKTSWISIYICSIAGVMIAIIVLLISCCKFRKPGLKFPKCGLYFLNFLALALYVLGFAVYFSTSKFDKHFEDPIDNMGWSNPVKFEWDFGLVACVISMNLMAFSFYTSGMTIGKLYS